MIRRLLLAVCLLLGVTGYAGAQCNPPGGFIQSLGTYTPGDVAIFGPNCGQIQDAAGGNVVIPAINPVSFGADPTCTKDSRPAFNAAFDAATLNNSSGYVLIPPGHFCFTTGGNARVNLGTGAASIHVQGSGQEVTILDFQTATNGLVVNFNNSLNSAHFDNMTVETSGNNTAFGLRYLLLTNDVNGSLGPFSDVTRVTFRGNDGFGQTHVWLVGFEQNNISNVNVIGCLFSGAGAANTGTGINFTGVLAIPSSPVVLNVIASNFIDENVGINYSTLAQGLTVTNSNFTSGTIGINVSGGLATALTELNVSSSQFEMTQGIGLNSLVTAMNVSNSLFILPNVASAAGIVMAATQGFNIVGNVFVGIPSLNTTVGIQFGGTIASSGGAISSNTFNQISTGITIAAGGAGTIINGNFFGGLGTTAINNLSVATNNVITDNRGYNPVGITAAASTGVTGSTITAGPSPETHYVKQSATFNAAITKGGQPICTVPSAAVPCVVQLGPNENYSVAWVTTQPTFTKDVH